MKTKAFFILFLGFSIITNATTQESIVDSLSEILASESIDTQKIEILNSLSKALFGVDPERAIDYANQAVDIASNIGHLEKKGYALKNVGLGYYYKGDFVQVLQAWQESLATFQEIKHEKGISNLLSNIGAVYFSQGDNTKALDYYLQALRLAESTDDDRRTATVLQNIGALYDRNQEYDKAEQYLFQALEICEKLGYDKGIATVSLNIGKIYLRQKKQYDTALEYLTLAKEKLEKEEDSFLPNAMIFIAELHVQRKNYGKALSTLQQAYDIAKSKDGKVAMALARNAQGKLNVQLGVPSKAIIAYKEAQVLGEQIGVNSDLLETYQGLTSAYKSNHDYLNVAKYQDSVIVTNAAIYDIEKDKKLSNIQLAFDIEKKESEIAILNAENEVKSQQIARANLLKNFLLAAAGLLMIIIGGVVYQYRFVKKTNEIITKERNKSDQLLLNILPKETADELKEYGEVQAKKYDRATVLFTDFVNFTGKSGSIAPEDLVKSISYYFKNFDEIIGQYNMEKIKTIGDAYMCVGGLPNENDTNALDALNAAAAMLLFVKKTRKNPPPGITPFKIRIGINSGPLVAGVVGTKKFQYDIWGDTVNIASRMESNCEPNRVNVSENVYESLKEEIDFTYRGEVKVKNKGKMKMYYLANYNPN